MSATTIQQMADRVLRLMDETSGARGPTAAVRLKRAARRLPREVRRAAERLALAACEAEDPKLLVRIDESRVAADYDLLLSHLTRRPSRWRAIAASVGGAMLVSVLLLGGVVAWALAQV